MQDIGVNRLRLNCWPASGRKVVARWAAIQLIQPILHASPVYLVLSRPRIDSAAGAHPDDEVDAAPAGLPTGRAGCTASDLLPPIRPHRSSSSTPHMA